MAKGDDSFPSSEEFTKHAQNLAELKRTRTQLERLHKDAIRRNSAQEIAALAQVQYMLLGVEIEATLRKIVTDPTGLSPTHQNVIWGEKSKADQWLKLLIVAFERHYNRGVNANWTVDSLTPTDRARYDAVRELVDKKLRPIIERRNKLAHGQWLWHLKSQQENQFKNLPRQGPPPDYFSLHSLTRAVESIAGLILTLTVSRPTFERDFDKHYGAFERANSDLESNDDGSKYEVFVRELKKSLPASVNYWRHSRDGERNNL